MADPTQGRGIVRPGRATVLGALRGLLVAENYGDIADEVCILCDALGIERPEYDGELGRYVFAWDERGA